MARLLYMTVPDGATGVAEFNELDDYYKVLECDCFCVVSIKIGEKYFDCFADDNGRLIRGAIPSVVDKETRDVLLVGNVIFANCDIDGKTTDLSDDDIRHIKDNIELGIAFVNGKPMGVACVLATR